LLAVLAAAGGVAFAVIRAFNDNLVFFYTPTQLLNHEVPKARSYRLGGMVETGSLQRVPGTLNITFNVTDNEKVVPVKFSGIVPDLFKEGKGVVAEGQYENGVFVASEILAKHDENYMPPGVKK
jgi:cytochrome c-type biogenesis protein CcmE